MQGIINNRLTLSFLTSLIAVLLLPACANDTSADGPSEPSFSTDELAYRWEVDRAFRNGKATVSLDGLYFDFTAQDSMSTNLMGQDMTETYQLVEDSVKTTGASQLYFLITTLDSSQLVLETNLRATPFLFQLKKAVIPQEEIQ